MAPAWALWGAPPSFRGSQGEGAEPLEGAGGLQMCQGRGAGTCMRRGSEGLVLKLGLAQQGRDQAGPTVPHL